MSEATRMNVPQVWSERVLELNLEIKRLNRLRLKGTIAAAPAFLFLALFTGRDFTWPVRLMESWGSLLIVAALGIRLWALGCIDGNKKRTLVTWGPYRHVRHPLYCGSLLFALGTCFVAGSLSSGLLLCLVLLVLYLPVLRTEERFLAERFGAEWEDYRRQTSMLLPRFASRLPRVEEPFHLRRPLRETGALLLLALIAFGTAALINFVDRRFQLPDWFF